MLAFGFISGLTLTQWLTEGHVAVQVIGLTANIGLPYTLKFLWAPVLDHVAEWTEIGLAPGENRIRVSGGALSDEFVWQR